MAQLNDLCRAYEELLGPDSFPARLYEARDEPPVKPEPFGTVIWRDSAREYLSTRPLYNRLANITINTLQREYPEDRIVVEGMSDPYDGKTTLWINLQTLSLELEGIRQFSRFIELNVGRRAHLAFVLSRLGVSR